VLLKGRKDRRRLICALRSCKKSLRRIKELIAVRTGAQQGGIGDVVGGLLGGSNKNNQDPRQQQKKKGGGLGDMLGL
jgi:hypothetical protein